MTKSKQKPKKVTFLLPSLASGGAERVLINLMNCIDRERFAPEFISFRRNGPLKHLINRDIKIHAIQSYRNIIIGFFPLLKKLRETKPDVIITTMAHMNFLLLIMKPLLAKKTRIIIREAITPSYVLETHKFGWFAKILYKLLYPRADLIISPAQTIIDEFKNYLKMDISKFHLLYNAVNIDLTRKYPPPRIKNMENRQTTVSFICAGRMHPQKGFDQLIEALPYFKSKYNWHLSILGGGSERRKLDHLVEKHNLENHITFYGYTKRPWPDIAAADCFLLPSRYEGLPNVVLEALSVGTPIISTASAGGIQEIANSAQRGNVQIANDMPSFVNLMRKVKPNPTENYRPSLLPDNFRTKTVINRFMNMLDETDEFSAKI